MSPEQISGQPVGPASDMFSWAATMLFAATGRTVFGADNAALAMHRVLHHEPEIPALPGELGDLVRRCLARRPEDRPAAHEVLLRLLGHDAARSDDRLPGGGARTDDRLSGGGTRAARPARRMMAVASLALAVAAAVVLWRPGSGCGAHLGEIPSGTDTDIQAVAVAHDQGRPIGLVADEESLTFWDLAEDESLSISHPAPHHGPVTALAASGPTVLTGRFDGTVEVWDVRTHGTVIDLEGHEERVDAIAIGTAGG
ncbi:hypothetical protein E1286_02125 [Nonomuraea terrae]|uniref:non-specific serine/threonine protein kinase n=1 Tax=Nonomuraea terrae TaxID=2530383 RepID=A0A4V2YP06_9ACTN|nr:hypothetical protein E1286_02125 [Nonomuraea terrae]